MPDTPPPSFFVTGGTVPTDSASYVARQADKELLSALLAGEYCFLLNSRQMGKSSLSVRTREQLQAQGVRTLFLDLQRFGGGNVTAEQWYAGMLSEAGRQLELRRELLAHWKENAALPAIERLMGALTQIALPALSGALVVFIDEVDAVRSLPFSTDEFFGALREIYNRRTREPELARLTFCLIGSATPSDLISDTRTSPFNIGRRIELRDFTPSETAPLAAGLVGGKLVLDRVLHWTGGHPYLTQSLCAEAAERGLTTPASVDKLVTNLFFADRASSRNINLTDVANRLLQPRPGTSPEEHRAAVLTLYRNLLRSKSGIPDDETDALAALLKLSGITRSENGRLHIRNRIYAKVFDQPWITDNLPDAELRRQKEAYRKGVLRTGAASAAVMMIVAALAVFSFLQAKRANQSATAARAETSRANRLTYISNINLIQNSLESGQIEQARDLLHETSTFIATPYEC